MVTANTQSNVTFLPRIYNLGVSRTKGIYLLAALIEWNQRLHHSQCIYGFQTFDVDAMNIDTGIVEHQEVSHVATVSDMCYYG